MAGVAVREISAAELHKRRVNRQPTFVRLFFNQPSYAELLHRATRNPASCLFQIKLFRLARPDSQGQASRLGEWSSENWRFLGTTSAGGFVTEADLGLNGVCQQTPPFWS